MIRHRRNGFIICLAGLVLPWPCLSRAAEVDRYLPRDTEVVVRVNVRQVLDSDLAKKYLMEVLKAHLEQHADVQGLLTAVGLDPFKDITSLTLAAPGKVSADSGLVIIRGKFDSDKFHQAASDFAGKNPQSMKIHKANHGPLYEGKDGKNANGKGVFATFLDQETFILSPSRTQVLDAAGKSGNQKPAGINKHLQTLLSQLDGKQGVWVAALPSKELKDLLARNPQTKNIASKLQALSGGVAVGNDIKAEIRIQTSDAKAALQLRQLLEGFKAILILAATNSEEYGPMLADLVSGIKIRSDQGTVTMEASVTADQIEKGLKK